MNGRKDIWKDARGFDKNPQNINRKGQPKSQFRLLMEGIKAEMGEKPTVTEMMEMMEYIQTMSPDQLKKFCENKKTPMTLVSFGRSILTGKQDDLRRLSATEKLMDRTMGKPKLITENKEIPIIETDTGLSYEQLYELKYGKKPE